MKTIVKVSGKIGYIDGYIFFEGKTFALVVIPNVEIIERQLYDLKLLSIKWQKYYNNSFFNYEEIIYTGNKLEIKL